MPFAATELQQQLEYAPRAVPQPPEGLVGWQIDDVMVCAHCAARVIARGFFLPSQAQPIWKPDTIASCAGCHTDAR